MAKVTYVGSGDPTDNTTCTAFGQTFTLGQPVEMDVVPAKLRANPTFEVDGKDKSHKPAAGAAKAEGGQD